MFKNLRKKKKGFTLIELIIVIAILAILAAVALPRLSGFTSDAKEKADIANAKTIANAVSILQAEGKLTTNGPFTLDAEVKSDNDAEVIEDYLQTVPNPKTSDTDKFVVTIDGDKIIVTVGEYTSDTADNVFFPEP